MGFYVNPSGKTKEQFLKEKGTRIPNDTKWENIPKGTLPVILVHNGYFTAAAIGFCKQEFDGFMDKRDTRPKRVFVVKVDDLVAFANDVGFNQMVEQGRIAT